METEFDPEYDDEQDIDDQDEEYRIITMKQKKEVIHYWRDIKSRAKRSFNTMQIRYRFLSNESQLYRWEKQIQNLGTRKDKLKIIWDHTLTEFKKAINAKLIVHDIDIRRWALSKALEINLTSSFKASHWWVWKFKSINRICSRKITKFVTKSFTQEEDNIIANALECVDTCKSYFGNYNPSHIFNTDQSGFNYEMHSGRSLAFIGTTSVEAQVQSLNAMTHSYTIQPTISIPDVPEYPRQHQN